MGRKNKSKIRKQEILEHFYQVVKREGFEGASIAKIAESMGVHPSLLIHYFKTKEEMTIALVGYLHDVAEELFLSKWAKIKDSKKRLETMLDVLFGPKWLTLTDDTGFYGSYYLGLRNEKIHASFRKLFDKFKQFLVDQFTILMDEGAIRDIDPNTMADAIITVVEGADFYKNVHNDMQSMERTGCFFKELFLNYLKTDTGQEAAGGRESQPTSTRGTSGAAAREPGAVEGEE